MTRLGLQHQMNATQAGRLAKGKQFQQIWIGFRTVSKLLKAYIDNTNQQSWLSKLGCDY